MTARIVDVAGFDLVSGHAADGELRASIVVAPSCTRSQFDTASASWSAATSGLLVADYAASATRATTATLAAAASVASPTDISSYLTAGGGLYGRGTITIPGYDQAYKATVSDANIVGYHPSTAPTPAVGVFMPTPSTPGTSHWMTVQWTISGTTRRVYHDIHDGAWLVNGDVVEPDYTAGSVATLTYLWDVAGQGWYVSAYTGDTLVREHGPDESPNALPLYFTPEARALGSFSTIKAAQINALEALPSMVVGHLSSVGVYADVTSDSGSAYTYGSQSGYIFESIVAREITDGSWQSGAFGFFYNPSVQAYPWVAANGCCDGRVLLHEIGHAWDRHALGYVGATWGVDPVPPSSPNAYDTVTTYYPGGEVYIVAEWFPTYGTYIVYNEAGAIIGGGVVDPRASYSRVQDEATIADLYPGPDGSNYYRSNISEWVAQCFMLIWADHVTGYNSSERSALITDIGGASLLADFNDYCVGIGILPSSW